MVVFIFTQMMMLIVFCYFPIWYPGSDVVLQIFAVFLNLIEFFVSKKWRYVHCLYMSYAYMGERTTLVKYRILGYKKITFQLS